MAEIKILKRTRTEAELTQRKFFKKTVKGKVVKVLRERYLREDICCGIQGCTVCRSENALSTTPTPSLPINGDASHPGFPLGHFVIPDTNVVLSQIDLITSPLFSSPVIFLQTVLDEVKHRSGPIYQRLRALVRASGGGHEINRDEEDRDIWVFYNEFCAHTAIVRDEEESPNDRNDRAIRKATQWYTQHITQARQPRRQNQNANHGKTTLSTPTVVLLTEDRANREKAQKEGIHVMGVRKFIEGMMPDEAAKLLDLLVAEPEETEDGGMDVDAESRTIHKKAKGPIFPENLTPTALLALLNAQTPNLYKGTYHANAYNYLSGSVSSISFPLGKPILLMGRENMNRAVDSDQVVVEVFEESMWTGGEQEEVVHDEGEAGGLGDDEDDVEVEEGKEAVRQDKEKKEKEVAKKATTKGERQPTGRVVGILKRNWRPVVCHVDVSSLGSSSRAASSDAISLGPRTILCTPVSSLLPRILVRTRQISQLSSSSNKLLITIDSWPTTSPYPSGHITRVLGAAGGKETERESLLLEFGVRYAPFGRGVRLGLPNEGKEWVVPPKEDIGTNEKARDAWKGREDFRAWDVCSIDPPGCQDIDDALHARLLPNGNIEAGVHIADVTHFVHPATPMDTEAASRGSTVYLVDARIDMLPKLLGTNLCSLREGVERLSMSVVWELTPDAEIVNTRFTKSVIKSKASFTYEEAQKRKDNPSLNDPLTTSIRLLNTLAIKLRAQRMTKGALNLASPEVKIHLESSESSDPVFAGADTRLPGSQDGDDEGDGGAGLGDATSKDASTDPSSIGVEHKALLETNSLVEEFMLLANISVARKIYEHFPQTSVLRRHRPPPKESFERLVEVLKRRGYTLDVSDLAKSLDECVDPNDPNFNTLVRIMATRCMLPAEYFCSGSVGRETFGHYGLASDIYTHFTSPIRRYADVLVHRLLAASINHTPLHPSLHSKEHIEHIMENINKRHRMAQMAGRASVEFYVGLALKARVEKAQTSGGGVVLEEAFVVRTFKNGVGVFVFKLGIEGLVLFKDDISYDAENFTVTIGSKAGRQITIGIFDKVTVKIEVEKDRHTQRGVVRMSLHDE